MNLCLLQPTMTANAPTNEADCLALLKFKESISHDPYMMLSSWNDSMHFYNWFVITWLTTPKSHGHVLTRL